MKIVSYLHDGGDRLAILVDDILYNMDGLHPDLPTNMGMFLNYWHDLYPLALSGEQAIREGRLTPEEVVRIENVNVLAPVPFPLPAAMDMLSGNMLNRRAATVECR